MSDQIGFFSRIGKLFKGGSRTTADLHDLGIDDNGRSGGQSEGQHGAGNGGHGASADSSLAHSVDATRSTFLRPWAKRDNAINQLQEGFSALTGLMGAVKESLDKQNQRQDDLVKALSNLPDVLRSIPETGAD